MLRVMAALHSTIEVEDLRSISQQLFFYAAETEHQLFQQRKKESVPGSVIQTTNVLFTSDDLKMELQYHNIYRAGIPTVVWGNGTQYFPISKGSKSWKYQTEFRTIIWKRVQRVPQFWLRLLHRLLWQS